MKPMKAVDLRQLIEDEVDDTDNVVFIATIGGQTVKFSIPEDTDFVHGEGEASIQLVEVK